MPELLQSFSWNIRQNKTRVIHKDSSQMYRENSIYTNFTHSKCPIKLWIFFHS